MKYTQKDKIKNLSFKKSISEFKNFEFVKYLTMYQPIKIIKWEGIKNEDIAFFKLWFFGWKNFKVKHSNYSKNKNEFLFVDYGIDLPFGLQSWQHEHKVIKKNSGVIIIDSLNIEHKNKILGILLFPILLFPILIRKILYILYFSKF